MTNPARTGKCYRVVVDNIYKAPAPNMLAMSPKLSEQSHSNGVKRYGEVHTRQRCSVVKVLPTTSEVPPVAQKAKVQACAGMQLRNVDAPITLQCA